MNTLEVLTLLLVVFAALYFIVTTEGNRITHPITFLSRLYIRVLVLSSTLFKG